MTSKELPGQISSKRIKFSREAYYMYVGSLLAKLLQASMLNLI